MAFKPEAALSDPQQAIAACQLVTTAAASHPSLLSALLFPTKLTVGHTPSPTGASSQEGKGGKRAKDGEDSGTAVVGALAVVVKGGNMVEGGTRERTGEWNADAYSALDGLWGLLQKSGKLQEKEPHLMAAVLRALVALWQVQENVLTSFYPNVEESILDIPTSDYILHIIPMRVISAILCLLCCVSVLVDVKLNAGRLSCIKRRRPVPNVQNAM